MYTTPQKWATSSPYTWPLSYCNSTLDASEMLDDLPDNPEKTAKELDLFERKIGEKERIKETLKSFLELGLKSLMSCHLQIKHMQKSSWTNFF